MSELDQALVDSLAKRAIIEVDPAAVKSPALRRLIEEVRHGEESPATGYNRIHNRHNRGR